MQQCKEWLSEVARDERPATNVQLQAVTTLMRSLEKDGEKGTDKTGKGAEERLRVALGLFGDAEPAAKKGNGKKAG
ncbi:MAG: hypothetical protein GTN93_26110 [Anaerolineae bacterium]|nr:hypothetical protein [Anaerolineae bacterium]